ncbi:MAG: hypothetical protein ACLTSZ_04515 [Lachnospiraceae bacterium]
MSASCFSANQINLAGEGAFHIGGLVSAVAALELGLSAGLSQAVAILLSGLAGAVFTAVPAVLKIKTNSSCACILADAQLSRTVVCNIYSHAFYL